MPRSSRPRRPHRPREVRIPVTDALVREVAAALDIGLLALRERVMQEEHFDQMADALNLVGTALNMTRRDSSALIQIQSAAHAMNAIIARHERGGALVASVYELEPLRMGINAAIAALPALTVNELRRAWNFLVVTASTKPQ